MSDINKLSERVIEYAERASAMADAAQGKKRIRSTGLAWLVLPAAGAGLYTMARSKSFTRQAKGAMTEVKTRVKTRATELPDELLGLVRQSSQPARTSGSSNGTSRQSKRRSGSSRRKSTVRTKTSS
jgi:hypothetical protein